MSFVSSAVRLSPRLTGCDASSTCIDSNCDTIDPLAQLELQRKDSTLLPDKFFHLSLDNKDAKPSTDVKLEFTPPSPDEKLSLHQLVTSLTEELQKPNRDLPRIYQLMCSYDASLNEWKRYEFWDDSKKYTRNLIATDNSTFALMLLCWNANKGSPVHNHAGSECMMRCVSGRVVESQYEVQQNPNEPLTLKHKLIYNPGQVAFINDSIGLHKVENPYDECAVTLHCYLPGYDVCKCYSEEDGQAQESYISYYSENGEKVEDAI